MASRTSILKLVGALLVLSGTIAVIAVSNFSSRDTGTALPRGYERVREYVHPIPLENTPPGRLQGRGLPFEFYQKHDDNIEGPDIIVPDQVCWHCQDGDHDYCLALRTPLTLFTSDNGAFAVFSKDGNPYVSIDYWTVRSVGGARNTDPTWEDLDSVVEKFRRSKSADASLSFVHRSRVHLPATWRCTCTAPSREHS